MFNNQMFDAWLDKRAEKVLQKIDLETATSEDMLVLLLKAQTNHFSHMDEEFRGEFKMVNDKFRIIDIEFKNIQKQFDLVQKQFDLVQQQFDKVDQRFDLVQQQFDKVDQRFEKVDERFDKITNILMWQFGVLLTLISGLYLKLII